MILHAARGFSGQGNQNFALHASYPDDTGYEQEWSVVHSKWNEAGLVVAAKPNKYMPTNRCLTVGFLITTVCV